MQSTITLTHFYSHTTTTTRVSSLGSRRSGGHLGDPTRGRFPCCTRHSTYFGQVCSKFVAAFLWLIGYSRTQWIVWMMIFHCPSLICSTILQRSTRRSGLILGTKFGNGDDDKKSKQLFKDKSERVGMTSPFNEATRYCTSDPHIFLMHF